MGSNYWKSNYNTVKVLLDNWDGLKATQHPTLNDGSFILEFQWYGKSTQVGTTIAIEVNIVEIVVNSPDQTPFAYRSNKIYRAVQRHFAAMGGII